MSVLTPTKHIINCECLGVYLVIFVDVTLRKAIRNKIECRHIYLAVQQAMLLAIKEDKKLHMKLYYHFK